MDFNAVIDKYRKLSSSERDKGDRFERLMQAFLLTDPRYAHQFQHVWLWNQFPLKEQFGGRDTGVDLVAQLHDGGYWTIQCKCFQENAYLDKVYSFSCAVYCFAWLNIPGYGYLCFIRRVGYIDTGRSQHHSKNEQSTDKFNRHFRQKRE